jgi:hypothetical protein
MAKWIMNRHYFVLCAAVAILVVVEDFSRAQQLLRLEGAAGTLFHVVTGGGDTIYAGGFTDVRFLQVREGMSESQVIALLGEPLERYRPRPNDGTQTRSVGMRWSRSANDSHYSIRVVLFKDGRAVDRRSEFYLD